MRQETSVIKIITASERTSSSMSDMACALSHSFRLAKSAVLLPAMLLALAACSTLPDSGPTAKQIADSANDPAKNTIGFRFVDVTPDTVKAAATAPGISMISGFGSAQPTSISRVGAGDILNISIFSAAGGFSASEPANATAGATTMDIPPLTVDESGTVRVPYAGTIEVADKTPREIGSIVERALAGKLFEPQVIVNVSRNVANTVVATGDVHLPGRYPLLFPDERLLDIVAQAGGATHPDRDTWVQVTRHGHAVQVLLQKVDDSWDENIPLMPGDHLQLTYDPRTFLAFGATDHVAQLPFDKVSLSLAEAIARIGGPSDSRADPTAVYLFRYEPPATAAALGLGSAMAPVPVLYRVDMLNPQTYFVITKFPMRDKDLIYVANARADKVYKFLGLINSAFGPVGSIKFATQ